MIKYTHKNISFLYYQGAIRRILYNNTEIIRNIYPAVRDKNWETIEPIVQNEQFDQTNEGIKISFSCSYKKNEINFHADYNIIINDNSVRFKMNGVALSSFQKNRIGLNLLHPIREIQGTNATISHTDRSITNGTFPKLVSPHQPFKDMCKINWKADANVEAQIVFSGDVFEMEDQRNWTDTSYKTYSTPLELSFPVLVEKGDKVNQEVELEIKSASDNITIKKSSPNNEFVIGDLSIKHKFPKIGICKSTEVSQLSESEIELIKKVGFNHYNIDIHTGGNYEAEIDTALYEAEKLNAQLQVTLHVSNDKNAINKVIKKLKKAQENIYHIILLNNYHVTDNEIIDNILPAFRKELPKVPIGGGTDAYFAELNRNNFKFDQLDFVNYTICPQVHAFDDMSVFENLEGQKYTVESAKEKFRLPVNVSAVSLKQRFNVVATSDDDENEFPQKDSRQTSNFCAVWTLGSIKALAESGADSISYYQTVGMNGIMHNNTSEQIFQSSTDYSNIVFPVYNVFQEILNLKNHKVIPSRSKSPEKFDGICLVNESLLTIILANYTDDNLPVKIILPNKKQQITLSPMSVKTIIEEV